MRVELVAQHLELRLMRERIRLEQLLPLRLQRTPRGDAEVQSKPAHHHVQRGDGGGKIFQRRRRLRPAGIAEHRVRQPVGKPHQKRHEQGQRQGGQQLARQGQATPTTRERTDRPGTGRTDQRGRGRHHPEFQTLAVGEQGQKAEQGVSAPARNVQARERRPHDIRSRAMRFGHARSAHSLTSKCPHPPV